MSALISRQRLFIRNLMKIPGSIPRTITHELSCVSVAVAHFRDFGVVTHDNVLFRIYRENDWFKAVPQLSAAQRIQTGLPEELVFVYWNRVVLAANDTEEEAMNVIKNIILELEVLDLV